VKRTPNLAPVWIAFALGLNLCALLLGIWRHVNDRAFPAADAFPLHQAGAVIRDLAGLHPAGDQP
jgi:hypothetical protein